MAYARSAESVYRLDNMLEVAIAPKKAVGKFPTATANAELEHPDIAKNRTKSLAQQGF